MVTVTKYLTERDLKRKICDWHDGSLYLEK